MCSTPARWILAKGVSSGRTSGMSSCWGSNPATLGTPAGRVEVAGGPAPGQGLETHPRIGVDHVGMADGVEQRDVVVAVGVGVAGGQVDAVVAGPGAHGPVLAVAPHELPVDGAVVHAVALAVAGGHQRVEAQAVGQRLDQVVGGGRGQHHGAAGPAVLAHEHLGVGLHQVPPGCRPPARRPPAPVALDQLAAKRGRLAGEHHRRAVLTEDVEHPEDEVLARAGCDPTPARRSAGRR